MDDFDVTGTFKPAIIFGITCQCFDISINSQFEVGVFRSTYKVPFPLFSDGDGSIHKSLGEVMTPYFMGIRIKNDGTHEIFYSKVGGFGDAEEFFQLMLEPSGLK